MLIAKIQDDTVVAVSDYREMFPNSSFPNSGPDAEFLQENSCLPVCVFKTYDSLTEKLASVPPYIEDGQVFTIAVEPLTPEEIEANNESKKAKVKSQAASLLVESDWSELSSVTNPEITPHLTNANEWVAYRAALRGIAVNPPVEVVEWPTKPEEVWS